MTTAFDSNQRAPRHGILDAARTLLADATPIVIRRWAARRRDRNALANLDSYMLDDIGLSAHEANQEAAKPFWRA